MMQWLTKDEFLTLLKDYEYLTSWLLLPVEIVFLCLMLWEFKYIRKEQQEKKDKEADRQLVKVVKFFLQAFLREVQVDTWTVRCLQCTCNRYWKLLKEEGCPETENLVVCERAVREKLEKDPGSFIKARRWMTYLSIITDLEQKINNETRKWRLKDEQEYDNDMLSVLFKEYQNISRLTDISEQEKTAINIIYKGFIKSPEISMIYHNINIEKIISETWENIKHYTMQPGTAKHTKLDYEILEKIYDNIYFRAWQIKNS